MLLSPSQYYLPQGLPQFSGMQFGGWPQGGPGVFGQPGPYGGNAVFAQPGQIGLGQQAPFAPTNPFASLQNPFAANSYLPSPAMHSPFAFSPSFGNSNAAIAGVHGAAQQIIPLLGQLAQQVSVHSAVTQQIGVALHQLAYQLAGQSASLQQGTGIGGQFPGQNLSGGATPGGYTGFSPYSGFNPQAAQAWGTNRPQTIQ